MAAENARKRIPTGYKLAAMAPGLMVLAVAGNHLFQNSNVSSEIQAIRQAGFPATMEQLNDYYPVPAGENAAELYLTAFGKFTEGGADLPVAGGGKLPPRGEPLSDELKTAASACLAANGPALDLLHKAAAVEGCRFPVNFSRGTDIRLPHLAALAQAAQLLELEALMKAEGGNPDDAAFSIVASFGAARSLRNEPLLVSQVRRMNLDSVSLDALERVLSRTPLADKQLEDLSKAIAAEESPEALRRALAGERCVGEDLFRRYGHYTTAEGTGGCKYYLCMASGVSGRDHADYLRLMALVVKTAGATAKETRGRPPSIEKAIAQQAPKLCPLIGLVLPALSHADAEQLKSFAHLRAACAALAVERFRMANRRLPDSLDEVAPAFLDAPPADPFDGQPIRYKKLAKGFVAYSVGPDLKDDGGAEPTIASGFRSNAPSDITFVVAR